MFKKILKKIMMILPVAVVAISNFETVFADPVSYGITMSPMNEVIILDRGEIYNGSFEISCPYSNEVDFGYAVVVEPFYVDESYNVYFGDSQSYNQMADWIKVDKKSGVLSPNQSDTIHFTINVPETAPAGGQYAAITVRSDGSYDRPDSGGDLGLSIKQQVGVSHIIYAEIAGTAEHRGEINDLNVQSFLLSGNISGSSAVKNTGNVHDVAKYTLQVFPLFSDEEVYTNEENPSTMSVLPDRTYYNELVWDKTPDVGIFNVIYTVEFNGLTAQVSKMVIKCPVWLLFIIVFAIAALVIWLTVRFKSRKNK